MWTRVATARCGSFRTLRDRNSFLIGEMRRSFRPTLRGYRNVSVTSASSPLPGRPRIVFACLGDQRDDDDNEKNSIIQNHVLNGQYFQNGSDSEGVEATRGSKHHHSALESVQQRRVRFALAYCLALDETRTILESHNSRIRRTFSTSSNPTDKSAQDTTTSNQRTEPDFAEYLAGTTDKEGAKESQDVSTETTPPTEAPIDLEGTEVPLDDHTETYKYIRRRQQNRWDLAREKTKENVQRALAGNVAICAAKLAAYLSSGSSSMFSEFIHSVVDCGNQSLLLLGLKDAENQADRKHPYGYGKSIYFYALVSALGTFFLGAGVSGTQAWAELMEPSLSDITWQVWSVLGFSFIVDGYVLSRTIVGIREGMSKVPKVSFSAYVKTMRDPATMAVLLEDGAACLGIAIAIMGIGASSSTGMPVFDGMAGLAISGLLASMGLVLVRINQRFLLGQAVDANITKGIEQILLSQRSIDGVHSIQSQWTGPDTFSFKAEVDFDGTYLAAMLMPRYQSEFLEVKDELDQELRVLLSWYAEDVMRSVEREVRHVEAEIRKQYPGAEFIELEPMSKDANRFAIDDAVEAQLRRIEIESLNRYLRTLYQPGSAKDKNSKPESGVPTSEDDNKSPNKQ